MAIMETKLVSLMMENNRAARLGNGSDATAIIRSAFIDFLAANDRMFSKRPEDGMTDLRARKRNSLSHLERAQVLLEGISHIDHNELPGLLLVEIGKTKDKINGMETAFPP